MNNAKENSSLFNKPGYWYTGLAIVLIICSFSFRGLWIADQFIAYNFFTLILMAKIGDKIMGKNRKYFKYIPLLIILYFLFSPGILKGFFLVSHLIILSFVFLLIRKQKKEPVGAYFLFF